MSSDLIKAEICTWKAVELSKSSYMMTTEPSERGVGERGSGGVILNRGRV